MLPLPSECVYVCEFVRTHACLIRVVLYSSCCISLYFYLFVFVFLFPPPLSYFYFFLFVFLAMLFALVQMPRPPMWHHGWLCPIRSAAGEGGEWDAGSSESGAGSHHTVLRPWNVSGTTTTTLEAVTHAASLSPSLSAAREPSHQD